MEPPRESDKNLPDPLSVYRDLGYITGDRRFPVAGRFVHLPGPGDSTISMLALSFPNHALRFRRGETGFVARYRVDVLVGDSTRPSAQLSETQEVRVRTFRETARRDESVIFQGLLTLTPGSYPVRVEIDDLASSAGMARDIQLRVPAFGPGVITAPIPVYRATHRAEHARPPSLIIRPTSTVFLSTDSTLLYLEAVVDDPNAEAGLTALQDGTRLWWDTVELRPPDGRLRSAVVSLNARTLPPGRVTLRAELAGIAADSTSLLVGLLPGWTTASYEEAVDYLRHAGTPEELERLHNAEPGERARLLRAFWERKDSVPETESNEFFEGYFRRLREADDRFADGFTAGWLTDRGMVYIALGLPDEVLRDLDPLEGTERSQTWLYRLPRGYELSLVFVDRSATGVFELTPESRRAFREAVEALN